MEESVIEGNLGISLDSDYSYSNFAAGGQRLAKKCGSLGESSESSCKNVNFGVLVCPFLPSTEDLSRR